MVLRQQNQPPLGEWHYVQSTLENIKESRLEKVFFLKKKKQNTKNKKQTTFPKYLLWHFWVHRAKASKNSL